MLIKSVDSDKHCWKKTKSNINVNSHWVYTITHWLKLLFHVQKKCLEEGLGFKIYVATERPQPC